MWQCDFIESVKMIEDFPSPLNLKKDARIQMRDCIFKMWQEEKITEKCDTTWHIYEIIILEWLTKKKKGFRNETKKQICDFWKNLRMDNDLIIQMKSWNRTRKDNLISELDLRNFHRCSCGSAEMWHEK